MPASVMTYTDHSQAAPATASPTFSFDTSKFAGKHKPQVAAKINAAKTALREATVAYNSAISAIEGKPIQSAKRGTLVICSRRVKFLRTEEQEVRQVTGHDGPNQSRVLEGTASVVVEQFELLPGKPTVVPAWVTTLPHFAGLQKDGHLSAL
jgi:hypothetical protein